MSKAALNRPAKMTPRQALAFVRKHGIVLASAKGPVVNLAQAIAGEPIKGSWWSHPMGREIFALFQKIEDSRDVLVCRAVGGKITFVHRRLWPALVRLSHRFPRAQLAQIHQEHTQAGHHENRVVAFPDWMAGDIKAAADRVSEEAALVALGEWVPATKKSSPGARRARAMRPTGNRPTGK